MCWPQSTSARRIWLWACYARSQSAVTRWHFVFPIVSAPHIGIDANVAITSLARAYSGEVM